MGHPACFLGGREAAHPPHHSPRRVSQPTCHSILTSAHSTHSTHSTHSSQRSASDCVRARFLPRGWLGMQANESCATAEREGAVDRSVQPGLKERLLSIQDWRGYHNPWMPDDDPGWCVRHWACVTAWLRLHSITACVLPCLFSPAGPSVRVLGAGRHSVHPSQTTWESRGNKPCAQTYARTYRRSPSPVTLSSIPLPLPLPPPTLVHSWRKRLFLHQPP
jgi:hypothetical protein